MKKLDKEIKEGNKILANFVTDSSYEAKDVNAMKYEAKNFPLLHGKLTVTELRFHKDWNWIMDTWRIINEKDVFHYFGDLGIRMVSVEAGFTKGIKETYDAMVELIKHYTGNTYTMISGAV